ncbi:MAG: radical SAM protein [Actinobacteria bacterium]|nr:radical SAM protein [Actinomycetota bacterium]
MSDAWVAAPPRVIFNFTRACNMACGYCYIPFDGVDFTEDDSRVVLRSVLSAGVESITFGGGDPLLYINLEELIQVAKTYDPAVFIQVDTNGVTGPVSRTLALAEMVDLIGLPIDALDERTSRAMRGVAGHGKRVLDRARALAAVQARLKINTVVSSENAHALRPLAQELSCLPEFRWSLYRFWPIGERAISNRRQFELSSTAYQEVVRDLETSFPNLLIEVSDISDRSRAYMFVTPAGRAYVEDPEAPDGYRTLGNIICGEDVWSRWSRWVDATKNRSRFSRRRVRL